MSSWHAGRESNTHRLIAWTAAPPPWIATPIDPEATPSCWTASRSPRGPGRPDVARVRLCPPTGSPRRPPRPRRSTGRRGSPRRRGLTLARYVAATRPGSRQRVFEHDGALIELVRARLPLERAARSRSGSAAPMPGRGWRVCAPAAPTWWSPMYSQGRGPRPTSPPSIRCRCVPGPAPGRAHAVNVADGRPLAFARAQVATIAADSPRCA